MASLLHLPSAISAKVHPVVVFSILDHHSRRNAGSTRVIGTLLGSVSSDGVVEVKNSFALPHQESESNIQLDLVVFNSFLELHQRVNPREVVVGWYSSTTTASTDENDLKVHHHLSTLCPSPLHLTVDSLLSNDSLALRAFIGQNVGVAGNSIGVFFQEVQVSTKSFEAERIGVDFITKATLHPQSAAAKSPISDSGVLTSNLESLESSLLRMVGLLDEVEKYASGVVKGEIAKPDNKVGRYLAETVALVPRLDTQQLEQILHGSMEDLLMVVYLGSLTRTQLALAQKLNSAI